MSAIKTDPRVDAYLDKHEQWRAPLALCRDVLNSTALTETIKWGGPAYTLEGRVLLGLAAYKNHCALWFHHGVFLADEGGRLLNAQDSTRGMRQWRVEAGEQWPKRLLKQYVNEAIANERAGKRIKPQRKKTVELPSEMVAAFDDDQNLRAAFSLLTPGRQREYAAHIADAKRASTRMSRLSKIRPQILAGGGLNDKYR